MTANTHAQSNLYKEDPNLPGYWFYDKFRLQGPLEVHQFVVMFCEDRLKEGSTLLDIASGEGALAQQLIDKGFSPSCTSWNNKCLVNADTYNLNLDYPFEQSDVGDRKYPLISAIEIIEHVENPSCFLRSCREILEEDGYLIISTPNVESAIARIQWFFNGCPSIFNEVAIRKNRHITMLWRQGIEVLFEQNGFEVREKHLLGDLRIPKNITGLLKRAIIKMMNIFLKGDLDGRSRLYVLVRSEISEVKDVSKEVY